MKLRTRYRRLNIWNKLFVWAAIFTIFSIPLSILQSKCSNSNLEKIEASVENIPSEKKIDEILKRYDKAYKEYLDHKFEEYSIAGLGGDCNSSAKNCIVPYGKMTSNFEIDWETGSVTRVTDDFVEGVLPDIRYKTKSFIGTRFRIEKKIGFSFLAQGADGFAFSITVIGIENNLVIIGMGLQKYKSGSV